MSEPSFLTVAQVERLHEKLINRFGGSHGLRGRVLMESAVIQPRNVYYYSLTLLAHRLEMQRSTLSRSRFFQLLGLNPVSQYSTTRTLHYSAEPRLRVRSGRDTLSFSLNGGVLVSTEGL